MFIRDFIAALETAGCRYCIVGGVAVNLHGIPRMTYDVDIVAALDRHNLEAVAQVLGGLGLSCRLPIMLGDLADRETRQRHLDERNLRAVTFTDLSDPLREVDVLVSPAGIEADDLVAGSEALDLGGLAVRVVSLRHLIVMKRASGRPQDEADASHLERLEGTRDE